MSPDPSTLPVTDFVEAAVRAGLLAAEPAATLSRESLDRKIPPALLAVQQGLLSATQVEIVETVLRPRDAISGYEILGLLGYGGMGVVYRARQLSLGRIVALKTVMLTASTNTSRLSRFEQEAQTVGKLLHPHIVTAYDFGKTGGRFFFAMEFVEGEDVERKIDREGPLSEVMTWSLVRQAAAGLAQAAELGVVHRDIKPANLLLVTPPTGFPLPAGMPMVKIADFGLALIHDQADDRTRLTADNSMVGSPHYMAPEQLGRGDIDCRADLYALGATAYHMLAGEPPFAGLTIPQIFAQKLQGEPDPLSGARTGLSLETVSLVQDLMARDPAQRIANYVELIRRIDELAPSSPTAPALSSRSTHTISTETLRGFGETQSGLKPTPGRGTPRARPWFDICWRVLLVALVLAGAGYAISRFRDPSPPAPITLAPPLSPTGAAAELFDGQSLNQWRSQGGNWRKTLDEEGAPVLAASQGVIERKLGLPGIGPSSDRMRNYRLLFSAALREAHSVELRFGIVTSASGLEQWNVLRMERTQVALGRAKEDRPDWEPVQPPTSLTLDPEKYHELRVERQANEWRAFLDNRMIGTVPLAKQEFPLFRISVTSNNDQQLAYFADFVVEELESP